MFSLPFTVERSVKVDKSPADVSKTIGNFDTWKKWSPWLCQEPECSVDISGQANQVGHSQQWNGKRIGSGEIKLSGINDAQRLDYDLHFLKPWKSQSKVAFELTDRDGGTEVRWSMQGSMPVFLFFMKKMMSAWVGNDYERGLTMLKDYLEKGDVPSKVELKGQVERKSFYYIGLHRRCSTKELQKGMSEDFGKLGELKQSGKLPNGDAMMSIYHTFDMINEICEYTAAFAYQQKPTFEESEQLKNGHIQVHRALEVTHHGPYRYLGNAWSAAMGALRALHLKASKSIPMYEVYATMPGQVPDENIQTDIYIPLK